MTAGAPRVVRMSWGRLPFPPPARELVPQSRSAALALDPDLCWLPYGNGRSYGDSCLNGGGGLIRTRSLDKLIAWDAEAGTLECEAGVLLQDIIDFVLPQGWFVPVTPGTQFVTVGGAIANDVHGKNHHTAGAFSRHVMSFELLRSNRIRLQIDRSCEPELFAATVGGLGLTGLVTRATLRLKRVPGPMLVETRRRFRSLDEFFAVDDALRTAHEYTVAWIDCVAPAGERGRGIYGAANHTEGATDIGTPAPRRVRVDPPVSLVGPLSLRLFNAAYFRQRLPDGPRRVHYRPFFYPLDGVEEWNRMYGPQGFFQFQCVLPHAAARESIGDLLGAIAREGSGSFLAVLKTFGDLPSEGLLSFARSGATLALDFSNRGESTRRLIAELEAIVVDGGGALYPAKDALMSPRAFRSSYPRWEAMRAAVDPAFTSQVWRRVTSDA